MNDIIINPAELSQIIENGIYSKYKNKISLSEFLKNEKFSIVVRRLQ